jgi:hypothetical protein
MDDFGIKPDVFVKSADTIMPPSTPGRRTGRLGSKASRRKLAG